MPDHHTQNKKDKKTILPTSVEEGVSHFLLRIPAEGEA